MKLDIIQKTAFLFAAAMALVSTGGLGCSKEALIIAGDPDAVVGDYGDAPDMMPCKYPSGITCEFPTRYGKDGAHHLDVTDAAFGPFKTDGSLSVSAEKDALDPMDPDGIQNIGEPAGASDNDHFDDGLLTTLLAPGAGNTIDFVVSVAPTAPKKTRYVNMAVDFDQNGYWVDFAGMAPEWIVVNMPIDVAPGTTEVLTTPEFTAGGATDSVWLRMTLSDTEIDPAGYPEGWNGKGEFAIGETEDYLLEDRVALDLGDKLTGGGGPGGGGPGGGGPGGGGPGGPGGPGGGPGGGGPGGGGPGGGEDCDQYESRSLTLCKGRSRTFLALFDGFAPDSVTASSSDSSVAGVDVNEANVTISGDEEGSATITVTATQGNCTYHVTIFVTVKKCGPKPKIECCTPAEIAKDPSRCKNCKAVGWTVHTNETPAGGGDTVNGGIEQTGSMGDTSGSTSKSTVVMVGNVIKIVTTYYQCEPCPELIGVIGDWDGDKIPDEQDWFPETCYDPNQPHDFEEQLYVDSFFDVFFDVNNDHEIFDQRDFSEQPLEDEIPPYENPYNDPYWNEYETMDR